MKYDVIVIGSGIAGLTSAAILARHGRSVLIVESNRRIGGSLKTFKRNKIPFDVGFHYTGCLGDNEILSRLWRYCGVLSNLDIQPFPEHGHDRLYIENFDKPVQSFFSYDHFSAELKKIFPDQSDAIDLYFKEIQKICSEIPFYNQSLSLTDFLRGYKKQPRSLNEFVTTITDEPTLQTIFCAPTFLYGVPADQASLETHASVAHGYYSGAYDIIGGGQAIVNSFKKQLTKSGVDTLTNQHVQTIETDGHQVSGLTTIHQKFIPCKNVIYTGHPSLLFNMVDPSLFRPAYCKRLQSLQNSMSMFALFGTIPKKKTKNRLDWVNHYLLPQSINTGPQPNGNVSQDHSLMLTSTEREQRCTNLPQDRKSVILLKPAHWEDVRRFGDSKNGDRPAAYKEFKEKIAAKMNQTAEQYWGDFYGPLDTLAVGTPLTFRDQLLAPEGCVYGAMHSLNQFNPEARTRLPGLWLAGQSTLMTGVVGSSLSGMVSAGEIVGLEPLWEKIRQCG